MLISNVEYCPRNIMSFQPNLLSLLCLYTETKRWNLLRFKLKYRLFYHSELEKSGNEYPCDFDTIWKWSGYSRKDPAKRTLLKLDPIFYQQNLAPQNEGASSHGGNNKEIIRLSLRGVPTTWMYHPLLQNRLLANDHVHF